MHPNIAINDIKVKAQTIRRLLEKEQSVQVTVKFRGREVTHVEVGQQVLIQLVEMLKDVAVQQYPFKLDGNQLYTVLGKKRKQMMVVTESTSQAT